MIKKILLGTLGAIALALPAQSQAYREHIRPSSVCPRVIQQYICVDGVNPSNPTVFMLVDIGDARYGVALYKLGRFTVAMVSDTGPGGYIAYAAVNDDGSFVLDDDNNLAYSDGDIEFFGAFQQEFDFLMEHKTW